MSYESIKYSQIVAPSQGLDAFDSLTLIDDGDEHLEKDYIITQDSIFFYKLNESVFEIQLPETNNRLLLVEFENFLALLEGSYHSKNGDLIIDFIKSVFSNKPVKYWSFSNSHPRNIGFARSLVANGATIVASAENQKYIKWLASLNFSLRPDRQMDIMNEPIFEDFEDDKWSYSDQLNSLEIYFIESDQADDYAVFYLPKHKLLFVGGTPWVHGGKALSKQTRIFYNEVIGRLKLDIDIFCISSPLR